MNQTHAHLNAEARSHTVVLRGYIIEGGESEDLFDDQYLSARDAMILGEALIRSAFEAMHRAAKDLAARNCRVCKNRRLIVEQGPGGRDRDVACPNCRPRYDEAMSTLPTVCMPVFRGIERDLYPGPVAR